MITAGVMGLIKNFRYILVTPSLLNLLEPAEVDAVIAHENRSYQKETSCILSGVFCRLHAVSPMSPLTS